MKQFIFIMIFLTTIIFQLKAQYSNYYRVDVNQNINSKIDQKVEVSGNIFEFKTIRTIDYGALELANVQKEKNRLESIKYLDEQQKRISIEVATNPLSAYQYGQQNTFTLKGKDAKDYGFKSFTMSYRVPHESLFVYAGPGRLENSSSIGVKTEIIFSGPKYNFDNKLVDLEKSAKMEDYIIGQLNNIDGVKFYVHKKDINRADVFGLKGYKATLIWEDDYQYNITDYFASFDPSKKNGITYTVEVNTYGNKSEVTFEDLEGRRYYLRQLIEKIISTGAVYDIKF